MKEQTEKNLKLLLATGLSLGLIGSLTADAATDVTYTGDTTDAQHAQSLGANASSPGAYADITMDYTLPDVVALGIYTNGEITSTEGAPLLGGRFPGAQYNSRLSLSDQNTILEDLTLTSNVLDPETNPNTMGVSGIAYSSSGSCTLTVEPLIQGGSTPLTPHSVVAQFDNQTNSGSFDVAFYGEFFGTTQIPMVGDTSSISNSGNTSMDTNNQAFFGIAADVLEPTVTNEDDTGVYEGGVRITVTSL